jgi:hypothetical protein
VFPAEELYIAQVDDSSSKEGTHESDLEPAKHFGKFHASYELLNHSFMCTALVGMTDKTF